VGEVVHDGFYSSHLASDSDVYFQWNVFGVPMSMTVVAGADVPVFAVGSPGHL
jgi:hypothetical protein